MSTVKTSPLAKAFVRTEAVETKVPDPNMPGRVAVAKIVVPFLKTSILRLAVLTGVLAVIQKEVQFPGLGIVIASPAPTVAADANPGITHIG